MLLALYIGLAGALGSMARHLVGVGLARYSGRLPWGTFVVNVVGSLVIGFAMALFAQRGELDSKLRFAITTGFLGGFTTYSAFAFETVGLLEDKKVGVAAGYVALTFAGAAAACWLGIVVARALR